ncbi:MAG: zinc dependent phospholipase C family protein [Terriglobales bacterium]
MKHYLTICLLVLLVPMLAVSAFGYSVLTHEQLVDMLWDARLKPLLRARFPNITPAQLLEAHAYAYGGAVVPDLGYYPFGNQFFSNLVHYARSGDFIAEMLRESETPDEFAFALGALSHYVGDTVGHPGSVNQAVAIEYPKLRAKYGKYVTYDEDKIDHLKVEFGFDMDQVALHRYAPQQYHDYVGFQVSKSLLERVFPVVYGLTLQQVLPNEDLAIGTFRWSVSRVIPEMTQVALEIHKKDWVHEDPTFSRQKFLYRLSRSDYNKSWGNDYQRPGLGARILGWLLRLVPKVGPFRALAFDNPTTQTEKLYINSINASFDHYRAFLESVRSGTLQLPNDDLDDGKPTQAGEYGLADTTYALWLAKLDAGNFRATDSALRNNIVAFYAGAPAAPPPAVIANLAQLQRATVLSF